MKPKTEKRLRIILPFVILGLGIAAAVVMIKSRPDVPTRPPGEYAPIVRVVPVQPETHQLAVRTQGTVTPRTESTLVSEVSGRVVATAATFASGGFFEEGDVLITVDPRDYELAVVTAQGLVAQARVRAETEEAQARVAQEEWKALGKGEGSPLATRKLQVEEARAALASAEAGLEQAQRNLERTRIRAPFACRVRDKLADLGQFVTPGVPVARIYAIDYVEVRLPIPDDELAYVDLPLDYRGKTNNDVGPEVLLRADFAGKRQTWRGRIVRVEGEIDPVTRMVHAVAQVDDPYGQGREEGSPPLAVGLFVTAEITGMRIEDAIVLPRSAMRPGNSVVVVGDDDRVHSRVVDVLRLDRDRAVITGGLSSGERVCVSTLETMTEGMKVRTVDTGQTQPAVTSDGKGKP
jgi:RND family efflux transporter MFP subunit